MKILDLEHPFFIPVGVRVAVVIICAAWGLFEISNANVFWAMFFMGLSVICAWRFATIDYAAIDKARSDAASD
jgi:hypothetical protein